MSNCVSFFKRILKFDACKVIKGVEEKIEAFQVIIDATKTKEYWKGADAEIANHRRANKASISQLNFYWKVAATRLLLKKEHQQQFIQQMFSEN